MASDGLAPAARTLRDLVTSVPLLSGFPDAVVGELEGATSVIMVAPEQVILNQGEINHNLYFLLLGTVDVYVDGGLVATLRRKGDLLGEMSVITNKPCSATIVAKTPVELLCINTDEFQKITSANKAEFNHVLYRIYSMILTDKVHLTNQKAKRLEETTGALERAKNELQEINVHLERRVVERTQTIQNHLSDLLKKNLLPLGDAIQDAVKQAGTELRQKLQVCNDGVKGAIQILNPIIQRFHLEVSLKNKRVLLAQAERKSQTVSRMALGGTGMQIELVTSPGELRDKVQQGSCDAVIIDDGCLGNLSELEALDPSTKFVFLSTKMLKDTLGTFLQLKKIPNIISVNLDDRSTCIRQIMTAVTKLIGSQSFGLEKFLNVGVDVQEIQVRRSDERAQYIDKVKSHFASVGVRGSILDAIATVLEELLMNAIYDAPHDSSGKPIYNHLPRSTAIELKPGEEALIRFASDGAFVAVSVEDPFGALKPEVVMKYLDSVYGGHAGEMNQKEGKGGAGRGLHQIVENSDFVVVNSALKKRTEIIAFFSMLPKQESERRPMLNYFYQ